MDIELKWLDDDEPRTATPRRNDMLATDRVAIVTTGHVTRAEARILDAHGYSRGEYGWLLSLRPAQGLVVPEIAAPSASLTGVIEKAREQGCSYLLFDRDAEALEGVATHDW